MFNFLSSYYIFFTFCKCISNQQKYRAHLTRCLAGNLFCFVCFPWRFSRCFQIIWHCQQNLELFSNLLTSIFFKSSLRFCRCCFQSIFFFTFCCKYLFTANIYHQHSIEHCLIFFIKTNKASKKHLNEIVKTAPWKRLSMNEIKLVYNNCFSFLFYRPPSGWLPFPLVPTVIIVLIFWCLN